MLDGSILRPFAIYKYARTISVLGQSSLGTAGQFDQWAQLRKSESQHWLANAEPKPKLSWTSRADKEDHRVYSVWIKNLFNGIAFAIQPLIMVPGPYIRWSQR
eukprot:12386037-Heterocapsa_arctica.AAC.1